MWRRKDSSLGPDAILGMSCAAVGVPSYPVVGMSAHNGYSGLLRRLSAIQHESPVSYCRLSGPGQSTIQLVASQSRLRVRNRPF